MKLYLNWFHFFSIFHFHSIQILKRIYILQGSERGNSCYTHLNKLTNNWQTTASEGNGNGNGIRAVWEFAFEGLCCHTHCAAFITWQNKRQPHGSQNRLCSVMLSHPQTVQNQHFLLWLNHKTLHGPTPNSVKSEFLTTSHDATTTFPYRLELKNKYFTYLFNCLN